MTRFRLARGFWSAAAGRAAQRVPLGGEPHRRRHRTWCLNSLRLAHAFKRRNNLDSAHFLQMNLFRPCFRPGSFDMVISNGVLHQHERPTPRVRAHHDPGQAGRVHLGGALPQVRTSGHRPATAHLQRLGRPLQVPRPSRGRPACQPVEAPGVVHDQYKNPHESKHTVGEVLGWLEGTGFSSCTACPRRPRSPASAPMSACSNRPHWPPLERLAGQPPRWWSRATAKGVLHRDRPKAGLVARSRGVATRVVRPV